MTDLCKEARENLAQSREAARMYQATTAGIDKCRRVMKRTMRNDKREGIALIIVLGMLAVMMVLGVAFVTAMRTERVAAGNFMEVMKARHLVYSALARAMDDIEEDLDKSSTPLYPEWYTNYPYAWATKSVDLHTGDAQELVPQGILVTSRKLASPGQVTYASGSSISDENAQWDDNPAPGMNIERINQWGDPVAFGTVNSIAGNILNTSIGGWSTTDTYRVSLPQWQEVEGGGKVSYLVVDASGLLDGSYVGGATARGRGASPREICIGTTAGGIELPDVKNVSPSFASRRDSYTNSTLYAYENMAEMINNNTALNDLDDIRNLGVFSRFPNAMVRDNSGDNVDFVDIIGKGATDLVPMEASVVSALASAFQNGAAPAMQVLPWTMAADLVFDNLLDYVDADSIPRSLTQPSVEAIPMLDEIWIQNDILSGSLNGKVQVFVECAYPCASDNNTASFSLVGQVSIMTTNGMTLTPDPLFPASLPLPGPATTTPMYLPMPIASFDAAFSNAATASYSLRIDSVQVLANGTPVDEFPYPLVLFSPVNSMNQGPAYVPDGRDVLDPVYNWDASHWELCNNSGSDFYPYENTLGSVNKSTAIWHDLAGSVGDVDGTGPYLYVANAPLQTVGELGYLYSPGDPWMAGVGLLNMPNPPLITGGLFTGPRFWRTVWLYDHGTVSDVKSGGSTVTYDTSWARVLDYFGQAHVAAGMTASHGAVNPNTPSRDVLASVFMNMQIDPYFTDPTAVFANWRDTSPTPWGEGAVQLADAIQAQIAELSPPGPKDVDPSMGGPLERLSDLGRSDISTAIFNVMRNVKGSALTEAEKESFYRNAAGLLNPRQNIFYILLSGKSKIAVEQRALAVVWRDPIADANGKHPAYVRWFTWLDK